MGAAKRRGTFEQRQAQAIERDRFLAEFQAMQAEQREIDRVWREAAEHRVNKDREAMGINTVADRQLECERDRYRRSRRARRSLLPIFAIGMMSKF